MTRRQAKKIWNNWVMPPYRCGGYKICTFIKARRYLEHLERPARWHANKRRATDRFLAQVRTRAARRRAAHEARVRLAAYTPEQRQRFGCIRSPIV